MRASITKEIEITFDYYAIDLIALTKGSNSKTKLIFLKTLLYFVYLLYLNFC